ncbi:hypothetical protein U1769_15570 [Sphingomonas sp. ZT3P38]|uniref:hypothetical protein n=1 Tax=Parasphingomonas zepuensis TaxID=3096161 RepID=UPI002FC668BC
MELAMLAHDVTLGLSFMPMLGREKGRALEGRGQVRAGRGEISREPAMSAKGEDASGGTGLISINSVGIEINISYGRDRLNLPAAINAVSMHPRDLHASPRI